MALSKGDVAPLFTLNNTSNEPVSLDAYKGRPVVILFFPLAFTGVCTEELCTMRDNMAKYEAVNAQVLAISVDSPFTLAVFKDKENLNFPLLSDFNKTASTAYDTIYEDFIGMHGVSKRSAFVVDAEGKIAYAEVLESAGDQPNYHAIQETVRGLS